jgi:hypothetical protein
LIGKPKKKEINLLQKWLIFAKFKYKCFFPHFSWKLRQLGHPAIQESWLQGATCRVCTGACGFVRENPFRPEAFGGAT